MKENGACILYFLRPASIAVQLQRPGGYEPNRNRQATETFGVTRNTLSELANGKRGISPEMAVRLSKVFGGTEEGWLVQQAQYDLAQVRRDRLKLRRLKVA